MSLSLATLAIAALGDPIDGLTDQGVARGEVVLGGAAGDPRARRHRDHGGAVPPDLREALDRGVEEALAGGPAAVLLRLAWRAHGSGVHALDHRRVLLGDRLALELHRRRQLAALLLGVGDEHDRVDPLEHEPAELRPRDVELLNNLGVVYVESGNPEAAIGCYRQAVALRPQTAELHNNLANALLEENRTKEASAHLREAARVLPASAGVHNNLGMALANEGQLAEAEQELASLVRSGLRTIVALKPIKSSARRSGLSAAGSPTRRRAGASAPGSSTGAHACVGTPVSPASARSAPVRSAICSSRRRVPG